MIYSEEYQKAQSMLKRYEEMTEPEIKDQLWMRYKSYVSKHFPDKDPTWKLKHPTSYTLFFGSGLTDYNLRNM